MKMLSEYKSITAELLHNVEQAIRDKRINNNDKLIMSLRIVIYVLSEIHGKDVETWIQKHKTFSIDMFANLTIWLYEYKEQPKSNYDSVEDAAVNTLIRSIGEELLTVIGDVKTIEALQAVIANIRTNHL